MTAPEPVGGSGDRVELGPAHSTVLRLREAARRAELEAATAAGRVQGATAAALAMDSEWRRLRGGAAAPERVARNDPERAGVSPAQLHQFWRATMRQALIAAGLIHPEGAETAAVARLPHPAAASETICRMNCDFSILSATEQAELKLWADKLNGRGE